MPHAKILQLSAAERRTIDQLIVEHDFRHLGRVKELLKERGIEASQQGLMRYAWELRARLKNLRQLTRLHRLEEAIAAAQAAKRV